VPAEPPPCAHHSDCDVDAGLVCGAGGVCRPQCRTDDDCREFGTDLMCSSVSGMPDAGACRPRPTDAGVDAACPASQLRCGTSCTDVMSDPRHCGSCEIDCTRLPNVVAGGVRCVAGACDVSGACAPGRAHCSSNVDDGCETDLSRSPNCGACGVTCMAPASLCTTAGDAGTSYACAARCATGMTACNDACVDTQTSLTNCGACDAACTAPAHASATCAAGRCGFACDMGFGDCDTDRSNGCETDLSADPTHCGACATRCSFVNAAATCSAGRCAIGACADGFGDCNASPADGCETDVRADVANCGRCGAACAFPGAAARCAAATCLRGACNSGLGDCDLVAANGCETDVQTSVAHCSACGRSCPSGANATATCGAGVCGLSCGVGFGDCDMASGNGCEAALATSLTNCGACGAACARPNATTACVAGTCNVIACAFPFSDCDASAANGCEANVQSSTTNCGACGAACMAPMFGTASCVAGRCVVTPDPGYRCSGTACEPAPARLVAPMNGNIVTTRRPTLRWVLAPATDGARVQLCRDRACSMVISTVDTGATSLRPTADLPPGIVYWRSFGRLGTAFGSTQVSPVWWFVVPNSPGSSVDTSWGFRLDMDGDGFHDIVSGTTAALPYRAFVYYGGPGVIPTAASLALDTGERVAAVGDIDADGYGDVVSSIRSSQTVEVHLGRGQQGLESSVAVPAPAGATQFGYVVAGAGDTNGDGFADFIVGSPASRTAYVFRGSATGPVTATPTILTEPDFIYSVSVGGAGDLDGDGYSEVVVGACLNGMCTTNVYVYRGGPTGTNATAWHVFSPPAGSSLYGTAVTGVGDVNGDGLNDLAIADGSYALGAGRVYIYHGSSTGLGAPAATLNGPAGFGGFFGQAVVPAGDVNRDGFDDVLITGTRFGGRVAVFLGSATGVSNTDLARIATYMPGTAGYASSAGGSGDVDGDARPDLVVGSSVHFMTVLAYEGTPTLSVLATLRGATGTGSSVARMLFPSPPTRMPRRG